MPKTIPMIRMYLSGQRVLQRTGTHGSFGKTIRKSEAVARSLEEATEYIDKAVGLLENDAGRHRTAWARRNSPLHRQQKSSSYPFQLATYAGNIDHLWVE